VQNIQGGSPFAAVHHVVPVRDDVIDRAPVVAKWDTAIHASRALFRQFRRVKGDRKFVVMLDPVSGRSAAPIFAWYVKKSRYFTHGDAL
jgi:hypothetical protein